MRFLKIDSYLDFIKLALPIAAISVPLSFFFPVYFPIGIVVLFGLAWISQNIFLGINFLILLHIFIVEGTKTISVQEFGVGFFLIFIIGLWFFKECFLNPAQQLIEKADYALVAFFIFCLGSLLGGLAYQVSLQKWLRELIPFLPFLIIFPLRKELNSKKRILVLLMSVLFVCLCMAFRNLIRYRELVSVADVYWQISASRQTSNEPFFFVPIVISVSILLYGSSWKIKGLMIILICLFSITLVVTFSRGYWVATIFSIFILFIFSSVKIKIKIIGFFAVMAALGLLLLFLAFGELGDFILASVKNRFLTVHHLIRDPSIRSRLQESSALLKLINDNPIIGYGLGKQYEFHSILQREMPTAYIHNAFLFLIFKLGLGGFISFVFFWAMVIVDGYRVFKKQNDNFLKALTIGIVAYMVGMIPLSFTSPQFYQKDSVLLIFVGVSIIHGLKWKVFNQGNAFI